MFGQQEKMIIVVAPDKYKAVAREMTHHLSKIEGCNAAYWTIKHFEDNEMQVGAKHWILSIGNENENKLTEDFRGFIKLKHDAGGLCYGYDANKAIIFAD
jgi:predicted AlkP superfamily phosphohydrolase/phosphomutase